MKKTVLILFTVFLALAAPLTAQIPNVTMELILMDSWAIYTLADYNRNPNLFIVNVTNNEQTTLRGWVILEAEIQVFNCADPDVEDGQIFWGYSRGEQLTPGQTVTYRNDNYFYDEQLAYHDFRAVFQDAVLNTGSSLPAGRYQYTFKLLYNENSPNWTSGLPLLREDAREVIITMPTAPELMYPGNQNEEGEIIYENNPTFQWLSTGARNGVVIYYRIIICEKLPNQSNDTAIDNLPLYTITWREVGDALGPPWKVNEIGTQFPITFPYPASEEGFIAGKKYVWQVFARSERNMLNSSAGFSGQSEVFCFQYGELPRHLSPDDGGDMDIEHPNFSWTPALGAQGYEIRVSGELEPTDPTVESNFWEEAVPFNVLDRVPDNGSLIPGVQYYWKVRAAGGVWSEPTSFFGRFLGALELTINCPESNPLFPQFSWTSLMGIDRYDLELFTLPDPGDLFHTINDLNMVFYIYTPTDPPLNYNQTYYAKVKAYRDNHLIVESEYTSFICEEPVGPAVSGPDLTVTIRQDFPQHPAFTWTPVSGATTYHLYVNNTVSTGSFIWDTVTNLFNLIYPPTAPELGFGNTYFAWVQPQDEHGDPLGSPSVVRPFTIPGTQGGGQVQMEIIIGP